MYQFGKASRERLDKAHPDLQRVFELAIQRSKYDFSITSVLRTKEQQRALVDNGMSTTMKSRHMEDANGVSHAVDIVAYVNGKGSYDEAYLRKIAQAIFDAAFELGIHINWGGHWSSFVDMPHFELNWSKYPPAE